MFGQSPVDGLAVDRGDGGDVVGRFEASLDLERAEAESDQFGDLVDRRQVLWGKKIRAVAEVAWLAIDLQRVWKSAGLGAFAPVGAATAEDLAGEALAGVGDAKCSMNKDLQGKAVGVVGGGELGQFPKGEFPGEDGKVEPLASGKGDAFGRGEGHLGGGVEFDLRADGLGEADKAEVLNDERVDLGSGGKAKKPFHLGELRGEDQNVHREVASSAPGVEVVHDRREILFGEVLGPEAGVEGGEAEVDRICPCRHGRLEAVPIPRWGQ
jgi:hypothetical protein